MPRVDLVDQSFLAVDPEVLGRALDDPAAWRRWWPDLRLTVHEARGARGVRWTVSGALEGTAEVWLEAHRDGAVAHFFLKGEPAADGHPLGGPPHRVEQAARRTEAQARLAWKEAVRGLKRELEADREVGTARR